MMHALLNTVAAPTTSNGMDVDAMRQDLERHVYLRQIRNAVTPEAIELLFGRQLTDVELKEFRQAWSTQGATNFHHPHVCEGVPMLDVPACTRGAHKFCLHQKNPKETDADRLYKIIQFLTRIIMFSTDDNIALFDSMVNKLYSKTVTLENQLLISQGRINQLSKCLKQMDGQTNKSRR